MLQSDLSILPAIYALTHQTLPTLWHEVRELMAIYVCKVDDIVCNRIVTQVWTLTGPCVKRRFTISEVRDVLVANVLRDPARSRLPLVLANHFLLI
ncbi:hypothetical protein MPTK1_8g02950 [Marchantia polymorpha subsp. ruderalis]|uniref:Uncharacterized protein n=1 Tax=Marchantia polymorpha TaxID=3197 RepID=A0A2R6XJ45_MARPO|nr:hypothetical protein MARPO_0012s0088 [Marchantia polymorpha]BBN18494.1 hypothetical protein Mp_8g02950 [Marchantia polymorpha subsp. ruderalis]|eukprot:PTQ46138.1 hypothetical protein MARPO_0012s0088 [Marchantia polymorpha]